MFLAENFVDEAVYFALHHSRRSLLCDGPILALKLETAIQGLRLAKDFET